MSQTADIYFRYARMHTSGIIKDEVIGSLDSGLFFSCYFQNVGPIFCVLRIIDLGKGIFQRGVPIILNLQFFDDVQTILLIAECHIQKWVNALGQTEISIGIDEDSALGYQPSSSYKFCASRSGILRMLY